MNFQQYDNPTRVSAPQDPVNPDDPILPDNEQPRNDERPPQGELLAQEANLVPQENVVLQANLQALEHLYISQNAKSEGLGMISQQKQEVPKSEQPSLAGRSFMLLLGVLPESIIKFYIAEVVLLLEDAHRSGLVYEDLQPDHLKLNTNFHVELESESESVVELYPREKVYYLTPQVILEKSKSTFGIDWWNLGVLIFHLIFGTAPFNARTSSMIVPNIKKGEIHWPETKSGEPLSDDAKDIIQKMLVADPRERLGAKGVEEVKAHAFFKDINWTTLRTEEAPLAKWQNFSESILSQLLSSEEKTSSEGMKSKYGSTRKFKIVHDSEGNMILPDGSIIKK